MQVGARPYLLEGAGRSLVLLGTRAHSHTHFDLCFGTPTICRLSRDCAHTCLIKFIDHLALHMLKFLDLLLVVGVDGLLLVHLLCVAISNLIMILSLLFLLAC